MLTKEQEKTLNEACELYKEARQIKDKLASRELFNKAWDMLIEYIDDVDDVYYRVVFANCIEELQRRSNGVAELELGDVHIQAKTDIYLKTLQWILRSEWKYDVNFRGHLAIALEALGKLFLSGKDYVKRDDHNAWVCFRCIGAIDTSMLAGLYLPYFVEDETTGKWVFTGVRPI